MKKIISLSFILILVLSGCATSQTTTQVVQTTAQPTATSVPEITSTPIPTLTETASTTPTATPTLESTPLGADSITKDNASALIDSAILGDGTLDEIASSPDGKWIGYASSIGFKLMDKNSYQQVAFVSSTAAVNGIGFSNDSSLIVIGKQDGSIEIFNTSSLAGSESEGLQPIQTIKAHSLPVTSVQFSNSNDVVISTSSDRSAVTWNVTTGKRIRTFTGFDADITELVFSPDYRFIAVGSYDGTIRIWNVNSGHLWREYGISDGTRSLRAEYPSALLFDESTGRLVSGWGDGTILIWQWEFGSDNAYTISLGENSIIDLIQYNASSLISVDFYGNAILFNMASIANRIGVEKTQEFILGKSIQSISFQSADQTLLLGRRPAQIDEFKLDGGETTTKYTSNLQDVTLNDTETSQDGNQIFLAGSDGILRIWDPNNTSQLAVISVKEQTSLTDLSLSADGKTLAVAADEQVLLYSIADLTVTNSNASPLRTLSASGQVNAISLSADGSLLASAAADTNLVTIWDANTGAQVGDLTQIQKPVTMLAFSPTGSTLAVGTSQKAVYIFAELSVENVQSITPTVVHGSIDTQTISWAADSSFLNVTGNSTQTMIINTPENKVLTYLTGATKKINASAISIDGNLIATAGEEGLIRIYNTSTRKTVATLSGHSAAVTGLVFSPDRTHLISWGADGTIRIWSTGA